jgi:hypothetical protein
VQPHCRAAAAIAAASALVRVGIRYLVSGVSKSTRSDSSRAAGGVRPRARSVAKYRMTATSSRGGGSPKGCVGDIRHGVQPNRAVQLYAVAHDSNPLRRPKGSPAVQSP